MASAPGTRRSSSISSSRARRRDAAGGPGRPQRCSCEEGGLLQKGAPNLELPLSQVMSQVLPVKSHRGHFPGNVFSDDGNQMVGPHVLSGAAVEGVPLPH